MNNTHGTDKTSQFGGYPRYSSLCSGVSMAEKREGYRLAKEVFAVEGRGKFEDPLTFSTENEDDRDKKGGGGWQSEGETVTIEGCINRES